jgi:5-methyltetrahydropteroyltriglutamate--homocysteine methyltransferase
MGRLAFATQKLKEITLLTRGLDEGETAIAAQLAESDAAVRSRQTSARVHQPEVSHGVGAILWQPVCGGADHLGRCVTPSADEHVPTAA